MAVGANKHHDKQNYIDFTMSFVKLVYPIYLIHGINLNDFPLKIILATTVSMNDITTINYLMNF